MVKLQPQALREALRKPFPSPPEGTAGFQSTPNGRGTPTAYKEATPAGMATEDRQGKTFFPAAPDSAPSSEHGLSMKGSVQGALQWS